MPTYYLAAMLFQWTQKLFEEKLPEKKKKKERWCSSFKTKEFFCKHKFRLHITFKYCSGLGFLLQVQFWANMVRISSYSSKIVKFSNCIWICLESSTWEGNLPFPFGFSFVCFNIYAYLYKDLKSWFVSSKLQLSKYNTHNWRNLVRPA